MPTVTATDAARTILAAVPVQPVLRLALMDAVGHALAEDVTAGVPLPPWTNASMDGYAVRGVDVRGATPESPRYLRVTAVITAGTFPDRKLATGDAMRIYTGGPLPPGADSVIRQEDSDRGVERVAIFADRDAGANVRVAGADLPLGARALVRGTTIGPHQVGLLAALAVAHPLVHRRPRVGILATGNEVVAHDHPEGILDGTRLADVNSPALAALVTEAGGVAVPLGIAPDEPEALYAAVMAADDIDFLITAGGASVGDHDHVRGVMDRAGVKRHFDRVRIRPGGPTAFGLLADGRPWLALPGNPVSAMVTFDLFGRVAIRAMAGHREPGRRTFRAVLGADVARHPDLDQYIRCTFAWPDDGGAAVATPTGPQGSGMLMSVVRADGLAIVSHGEGIAPRGDVVHATTFGPDAR